jgi:histone acetyltransferase 1
MNFEEWVTPARAAIHIHLARKDTSSDHVFHPDQTEFLFEADAIIGYKMPRINLAFRARDMRPTVRISHDQMIRPDVPGVEKLMDLRSTLEPYFAPDAFDRSDDGDGAAQFMPPGTRLAEYRDDGRTFEVWGSSLSDRKAMAIMKNMQILIPMFIEGGTVGFLADDDDPVNAWTIERWSLFLLYEVEDGEYSLVGFATSYRLWVWPAQPTTDPQTGELVESSRERISQFLILPPYQHQSHGVNLYNAVTSKFLADPNVFEITVEDPNEHFDNLRDYCDLARLYGDAAFADLQSPADIPKDRFGPEKPVPVDAIVDPALVKTLCQRYKLIPRQVQRMVELHLLRQIPQGNRSTTLVRLQKMRSPKPDDRRYYLWRLLVKARVYLRNYEELQDIDESERVPKLDQIVDSLQEQYDQLTEGFLARVERGLLSAAPKRQAAAVDGKVGAANGASRKRRIIEDDSDTDGRSTPKRQATEPLDDAA